MRSPTATFERRCTARSVALDIVVSAPDSAPPPDADGVISQGADYWPLALTRELDDLILHLRTNEIDLGTWVFRVVGDARSGTGI